MFKMFSSILKSQSWNYVCYFDSYYNNICHFASEMTQAQCQFSQLVGRIYKRPHFWVGVMAWVIGHARISVTTSVIGRGVVDVIGCVLCWQSVIWR